MKIDDVDFYLTDLKSKFDKIKPNTYYLSYSGGKDSHFLYWFIKEYLKRNDIKIVGINTYMEHHEILQRILKNSDDGKFTPIHDLSDELLDKIYAKYNIEIPEVYNHICRTDCMGCPYGSYKHDTEKELKLINKNQLKFVSEYFKESYEVLGIKIDDKLSKGE